ncbi:MAG: hypothetical protein ABI629_04595 [bacterium]
MRPKTLLFIVALSAAFLVFAARWFLASASEFSLWDDEGFVVLMLRDYLSGNVIYSGFYAQYGPFAFQALALLHRLLGLAPSNDSVRISSLLVYAATFSVWTGIAVSLLRSRAIVILFALGLSQHLMAGTIEPGHPQDVGALLVGLCAAAALLQRTASAPRLKRWAAIAGGAALGGLLLTKLNVGVFVAAALLFQAPLDRYGWRFWRFGILLLPFLLMQHRLHDEWVGLFCLFESVGLLLFLGATLDSSEPAEGIAAPWLGGLIAAMTIILGIEMVHGATPRTLADGIIFQHLHFPSQATQEGFFPVDALYVAALSVVVFLLLRLSRRQTWSRPAVEACKIIVAATGLAYAIGLGADYVLAYGLTWVWLLITPKRVDRTWMTFVGALALLLPLQAYPVAGTQAYLGSVPLTLLCALTFDDLVADSTSSVIHAAMIVLAAFGLLYECRALNTLSARYAAQTPLALPGASLLRLPAAEVDEYRRLTERMQQFDAFVSEPGLLSLYAWTDRSPPTHWNAGAWMRLIVPERQEEIVAALQRAAHPGAAVHPRRAAFWTEWREDFSSPLAGYLEQSCSTIETIGPWQVRDCSSASHKAHE